MAACECGTKEQTAEHIIISCLIYQHQNGACALLDVDKSLVTWQTKTCPPFSRLSSSCPSPPNEEKQDQFLRVKIKKYETDLK